MPTYATSRRAVVPATPERCFALLTDVESLPSWQGSIVTARTLARDDAGLPTRVAFEADVKVRRVRYVLDQELEPPHRIGSRYVEGDFADMGGEWRFDPHPDGTCATFSLEIDPGRAVPRPVRRMLAEVVVRGALRDLAERAVAP